MKLKNSLLPACCCAAALLLSGCGMGNSSSTADDPALANNPNYDVPVYENSPSAVKLQHLFRRDLAGEIYDRLHPCVLLVNACFSASRWTP